MVHTHYTTLISPANLNAFIKEAANHGPGLTVLDCRFDLTSPSAGRDAYAAGHIFGAHYVHLELDLSGKPDGKNGRHPLPDRDTLVRHFKALGIRQGQQVVAYDAQGGAFAARLWWLMRWLGHEAVAVLDGGLQAWEAAGLPLTSDPPEEPAPGDFEPGEPLATTVDANTLMRNLQHPERLVVDARAPDRYRGENETLDPVGGHIPGAVNRCFKDNLGADGRFKSAPALHAEFALLLDKTPPEHVVLQCGSGVTACHNALAMEVAGLHGASLYPGSWSEWSSDPARPVATGPKP